ncbi:hypothetical protein BG015_010537 [Linnemannia schmuckeri]|uniref:RING-type domain-containing protein n=1 Tax=Linnemannia schmuckeri TaxID=64567 RepID=A0A9P5RUD2_9FUNG|nr:hypothetical protein BG015_010537 [Linnemannia schmuckeri]
MSEKSRPLLLEYTSETTERARQEELYSSPSRTLQWCLAPLIFIPASVLLIQILKTQNQQPDSMRYGITLTPTLSIGVDIMGIGVVLVSVMGLLGVAKGCRRLMNLYFGLVMCFIAVQVGYAVVGFMSGAHWVHEALEKSWDKAYLTDKSLIHDLQIESRCQGFYSRGDRAVAMPPGMEDYLAPCAEILNLRFGKRLQRMAYLILCIRMIQLTGVFLLSVLFKHLAVLDQEDLEDEDSIKIDEESPYFKSEKQLEYENSRVPLLAGEEDEDLPHYSAYDYNNDSEDCEDSEDEDSGDDEERLLGSRRGRAYRYLPEYTEDEREPQGAVYKCQANLINPPQPPHDNLQSANDKDSSGRILAESHFAFASTQSGSLHRLADMRKESKPPDRPPATKAAIQDITSILTSFGKTLGPRSPSLSKHGPKDSTNVNNNSDSNSKNHNINMQPQPQQTQQQSQPVIPAPPPPLPKARSIGPIGVCGFHVHASTWENFKVQLCHAESATGGGARGVSPFSRTQGLERDQAFAEGHHQLILRHSYLHGGFIRQARKDGCKAQMTTVAQWTAWERGIVDRDPPRSAGVTVPNCFCGYPMRLSYLYNGQEPQMNYVCALRFQDVQRGCSRVLSSAKWAVRKKPVPIQPMSLEVKLPSTKIQPRRDESGPMRLNDTGLTVAHGTEKDDNGSQEALSAAPLAASLLDHKPAIDDTSRDSRQDSGIEVDENEAEGKDDDKGSELDWSRSTEWCLNAFSRHKMRLLHIPTCLLEMNDRKGNQQGRQRSMPQEEARKNLYDQWGDRRDYSQHEQRKTYDDSAETERSMRSAPTRSVVGVRSLSVAQMRDLYLPLEKPREYSPLIQRLRGSKMLATERERSEKMLERSETRLRDWEESIERLEAYVKELCQDGLDNSTLLCRVCGKGTFLHANVPCYHLVMCDDCIKTYQRCVVCSTKIESSQRIYW